MPDLSAAFEALGKLVDKVGPWGATLMVVVVVLALRSARLADIARRQNNLERAKFEHAKA